MGPAKRLQAGLAHAEIAHLAGQDQLVQRPPGLLDRYVGIEAMLVVQVDVVHVQTAKRRITGGPDHLGPRVHRDPECVTRGCGHLSRGARSDPIFAGDVVDLQTELGGDDDFVTTFGDDLAQQDLVAMVAAVGLRGVPEADTHVEGSVQCSQTLGLVGRTVVFVGHRIAPDAKGRYLETLPENMPFHLKSPFAQISIGCPAHPKRWLTLKRSGWRPLVEPRRNRPRPHQRCDAVFQRIQTVARQGRALPMSTDIVYRVIRRGSTDPRRGWPGVVTSISQII